MRTLVIYGGRFQPPHRGHKASYDHLVKKFGEDNVYVASANKPIGPKDPFTWDEKKKIFTMMGLPPDKFIEVKSVYNAHFINEAIPYDPDNTILILALSKKDADRLIGKNTDEEGYALKKNGERAAIQWLRDDAGPVSAGHIYVVLTPTIKFKVAGQPVIGATQIREMYANADDKQRIQILKDLYGKVPSWLKKLFDKRLSNQQTESIIQEFIEFVENF